eukprot:13836571-Heterocapsa_arctica.AAC.1
MDKAQQNHTMARDNNKNNAQTHTQERNEAAHQETNNNIVSDMVKQIHNNIDRQELITQEDNNHL